MKRRIIHIEESRCNGCGLCAAACHEGAIEMVNGKARLTREDYCDGLGDCLPACPTGAITFEEREAPAYDHAAVLAAKAARAADTPLPCGCPGSQSRAIRRPEAAPTAGDIPSELRQWPVQIKLAPVNAPYFDGCDLLIAADCTAYAYGAFHRDFIRGRVTLIGCPKLDEGDYSEKLTAILAQNDIRSVTVVRMAVPCCGGIQRAAERAVSASGKPLSLHTVIVGTDGTLLRQACHTLYNCVFCFSGETCISIRISAPSLAKPPGIRYIILILGQGGRAMTPVHELRSGVWIINGSRLSNFRR